MNNARYLFALYQDILTHSQSMLRLAANSQWEELTNREVNHYLSAVEKLTQAMQQQHVTSHTQDLLRPVLRHILDNEAEIKQLLQYRQEEISSQIQQAGRQKSVNSAYSQSAGVVLFPTRTHG
ncbi:flagella biosynthesis regulatory protein FliT [Erwinia pyrifoliae]|uniref:Flagellar protein FliT n=1 Tax=Erwinia pyrifoliae TaxID=79967 RepID=A0ABY5XBT7_ERWPY|nr:flagella biosynthesis regulatory protein FliT [Erwinia pyrifoliae]AUX72999.1 flagella biosynthesis regulatory protein FliT [Erwinia pyrifoliae]MCA8876724.1 flagella biosynthesis regulatory protein FliT [Erwinia pyrifoliae]UWS34837.1 flagella biosynthesis regulatory protein FliT [Erwinia pyrifoliae]UXK10940.1 flagella biosynthesis regulatory protein FliT [Erwinia pyrifoliae]CAX55276.1 Flagellar protein FliT [Erwinia pyrifoliae Ep1/96]